MEHEGPVKVELAQASYLVLRIWHELPGGAVLMCSFCILRRLFFSEWVIKPRHFPGMPVGPGPSCWFIHRPRPDCLWWLLPILLIHVCSPDSTNQDCWYTHEVVIELSSHYCLLSTELVISCQCRWELLQRIICQQADFPCIHFFLLLLKGSILEGD